MRFTKMHGIGNDYIYVDGFAEKISDPAALAVRLADRHFGIGGDGLIYIIPSSKADVRMRMFNADGSEAEMCGNGVRCVAKYAFDHGLTKNNPLTIETGRGVLTLKLDVAAGKVQNVAVDMGPPILDLPSIPVNSEHVIAASAPHAYCLSVEGFKGVRVDERLLEPAIFVSVGNPHAVFFTPNVAAIDVARFGPMVENHAAFPRRVNVHWVQVHQCGEVTMRTWERGAGITLACGTGACAVAVAGALAGITDAKLLAHLPGGDLKLEWPGLEKSVLMTGPATEVFTGEWQG